MRKQKPFVSHRGITIYETFKGRSTLTYWYALEPSQNEDSDRSFDIRCLPRRYRSGLTIERSIDTSSQDFREALKEEKDAHKTALQRAIDDGYNFSGWNFGLFFRRIFRYARRSLTKQSTS